MTRGERQARARLICTLTGEAIARAHQAASIVSIAHNDHEGFTIALVEPERLDALDLNALPIPSIVRGDRLVCLCHAGWTVARMVKAIGDGMAELATEDPEPWRPDDGFSRN